MNLRFLFTAAFLFLFQVSFAQNSQVKKQAEQMGASLVKKDYGSFVGFSYPKVVAQMGGKDNMAAAIAKQMEGMEKGGIQIESISYEQPSEPVTAGKELQCTITQNMVMKLHQGRVLSRSTLIGISTDKGNKWYFVDAGERDIATVRQSLPNISKSLKLPKPEQPRLLK